MIERWRIRRAAARQQGRVFWTRSLPGRRSNPVEEFQFVPSELRTPDPSFLDELNGGYMGLAGVTIAVGKLSPFTFPATPVAWQAELHGFGWLNHLSAVQSSDAAGAARTLIHDWIDRSRIRQGVAWRTDVLARRVISWVSHSALILEGAEPKDFRRVTRSLATQLDALDAACRKRDPARLQGLIAVVLADLVLKDQEQHLARSEPALLAELQRQILADGCHISRKPEVVLDLVIDLLPLRQSYGAQERRPPDALVETIQRMLAFLQYVRLGNGNFASFHVDSQRRADALSTVLLYGSDSQAATTGATASGYVRLEAAGTILVVDCGSAPPLEHSGISAAGCLSFEMSDASAALFINGTATAPGVLPGRVAPARATASRNTLCVNDRSSARFIVSNDVIDLCGSPALVGPKEVLATCTTTDSGPSVAATHNGYVAEFNLIHSRKLTLSPDGRRVTGTDKVAPRSQGRGLTKNLPVAIHFHLDPAAVARATGATGAIEISLPGDRVWRLECSGGVASVETGVTPRTSAGINTPARQIVLRATCSGEHAMTWTLERQKP